MLIDSDGILLAGNATQQAAVDGGIAKVRIVDADGTTIVAVRVSGLTPEEKAYLAVSDNRAAELASWDPERLRQLMEDGYGEQVNAVFYPKELEDLLQIPELPTVPEGDPDWMPRRVAGTKAIDWPQLLFGSYRFELMKEVSLRLQERLKVYQTAAGGYDGLAGEAITLFTAERVLREAREDAADAAQVASAMAGTGEVTVHQTGAAAVAQVKA